MPTYHHLDPICLIFPQNSIIKRRLMKKVKLLHKEKEERKARELEREKDR